MSLDAVDCQSFAGGFTLGVAQAGFTVTDKRENVGGFGVPIVDDNRGLINNDLNIEVGVPESWRPVRRTDLVFGNPPCSGFSAYTTVANQTGSDSGRDHAINQCMWDFANYAAACRASVIVMESVQLAYTKGRDLMQELRALVEEKTGYRYDLIHVLHNNGSIGGASMRRRYFMVLARRGLKFGIEPPVIKEVPLVKDVFYDLESLPLVSGPQRYRRKPRGGYAALLRSETGLVDGHDTIHNRENTHVTWIAQNTPAWYGGEFLGAATRRIVEAGIPLLPTMYKPDGSVYASLLSTDPYRPRRWHANKTGAVITGTGVEDSIHPWLPRTLTFREATRIMGFPDDWSLKTIVGEARTSKICANQKWLGKGISVPCGEWIAGWSRAALEGRPGSWRGDLIGDHEWLINVTNDFKAVYNDRTGEAGDFRSAALKREMAARSVTSVTKVVEPEGIEDLEEELSA